MTTKEYNGWTNYETWLVKLWMDNDEGSSNYWQDRTVEEWDNAEDEGASMTKGDYARIALADCLKEHHEEAIHEAIPENLHASFIMDLLNGALSEVDWREIAESLLTDNCEDYSKDAEKEVA